MPVWCRTSANPCTAPYDEPMSLADEVTARDAGLFVGRERELAVLAGLAAEASPHRLAFVTGPAGIFADFSAAFEGIDGLLLLAAFGVVLVILLVVYRSPLLPLLVIATAGLALTAANAVAYLLADGGLIGVNGQSQGIASILVVGAATDYGLLLTARFREELRRERSKYAARRIALRTSAAALSHQYTTKSDESGTSGYALRSAST